ncbi:signal transduction histidine kinase [Nocardia transvalensis]|uniref:histidine kinase n=1 Tax=Nocardia transvalensis TaxID=37333 RepID=A0A7W9UK04_9NOCA|nr:histidine kinase [Nocardia transvalensis]MBB5915827.1 signal transduction histidine kinase [Nocardia transvalensis]
MERLRQLGRSVNGEDPEAGLVMRVVGAGLLAANLLFNHRGPVPAWFWAALGTAYACWLVYDVTCRRYPRISLGAMMICAMISAAAAGPAPDSSALIMLGAAVSILAQHLVPRVAVILTACAILAVVLVASALLAGRTAATLAAQTGILLIVLLLGLYRRQYRMRVRDTELLLEQTRRAQHEHARAAALDERARIAREMHDVLAHSLGALSVQLEVAEALLSEKGDLPGALSRVRRSRRLAVDGLTEARGAVAALRSDIPPLPDAVGELADAYRRDHHLDVTCRIEGTPRPAAPAVTVSLLRATREALTNAGKHAPGRPVTVLLEFTPDHLRLSVRNPLSTSGSDGAVDGAADDGSGTGTGGGAATYGLGGTEGGGGYGLAGMRERIALVGGTLSAGPDEGGWVVTAEVPG